MRVGRVRNSRGGNRGFFQNPSPPDGPRRPGMATGFLPAAFVHVLGNGTIAGDGTACPCRWPDTARPPVVVTRAAPPGRRLCYSTAREDEGEKTTSRTPSRDKSARQWAGTCRRGEEQSCWTRTKGALTPEGHVPAAELLLRSGTPLTGHLLFAHPRSSLITPLALFTRFCGSLPPGPHFPAIHPLADWPPFAAKVAPSFAATDISDAHCPAGSWR